MNLILYTLQPIIMIVLKSWFLFVVIIKNKQRHLDWHTHSNSECIEWNDTYRVKLVKCAVTISNSQYIKKI